MLFDKLFKKKEEPPAPATPKAPENVYEFVIKCNDEKSIKALSEYQKEWTDSDDKYEGMTMKDLKESCRFDEKIYKYPPIDVPVKLTAFLGDDGSVDISGYVVDGDNKILVGMAAKTKAKKILKILQEESPSIAGELYGGNYWKLESSGYVDDAWSDQLTVRVTLQW